MVCVEAMIEHSRESALIVAISLNPEDAHAYVFRGNELCNCNLQERALEDYKRAIKLNTNCARDYGISFGALKENLLRHGLIFDPL